MFRRFCCVLFIVCALGCSAPKEKTWHEEGGMVAEEATQHDLRIKQQEEIIRRQETQIDRLQRELDDLKRQEMHNNSFRRYEGK